MRRRTTVGVGALVLAATLVGCRRSDEPPLQGPPGPTVAERVKVLNGDVYVIDGQHVRLAEAATPQPIPDARCWAEALAAKQAAAAARDLFQVARVLRIEPTGKTDEYNRTVAHVFLDNQDLGRSLHDQGLAAETATGRFGWCEPVSQADGGAPDLKALMNLGR